MMKLAFFLVGFFLVLCRLYHKSIWPTAWHTNKVTITIRTDHYYERIRYKGNVVMTDDETDIKSMDGYVEYQRNDLKLSAENDSKGAIVYDIRNHGRRLAPEGDGKGVIREALREMINYGFDARERMYRVYQRGGDSALRQEMGQLKSSGVVDMYRKFLLSHTTTKQDSL